MMTRRLKVARTIGLLLSVVPFLCSATFCLDLAFIMNPREFIVEWRKDWEHMNRLAEARR